VKSDTVLRRLIATDIACSGAAFSIGFFGDPFLTGVLRAYQDAQLDADMSQRDWLLLPLDVALLALSVAAWVALWRGAKRGRFLYTILVFASIGLLPFDEPMASSGLTMLLLSAGTLVQGVILGTLYFSDLRHRGEPNLA